MEELKQAAVAYYNNSSSEIQGHAWEFFKSLDRDGDGRISFGEFTQFLHCNGYNWVDPNMFLHLDANGDGCLDFWEIMTFYYMVKTRFVCCKRCGRLLSGLYFTCVNCFDDGKPYDICSLCYSKHDTGHHHNRFMDNYVLLRSKIGVSSKEDMSQVIQAQNNNYSTLTWVNYGFQALEWALNVGNFVGFGCSIM